MAKRFSRAQYQLYRQGKQGIVDDFAESTQDRDLSTPQGRSKWLSENDFSLARIQALRKKIGPPQEVVPRKRKKRRRLAQ